VTPSEHVDRYRDNGQEPPYVPREMDGKLEDALKRKPFVLVVGPSKAVKSRTACEAVRKLAPSAPLVIPRTVSDLEKLIDGLVALRAGPGSAVDL
jgi:hypothetical protein